MTETTEAKEQSMNCECLDPFFIQDPTCPFIKDESHKKPMTKVILKDMEKLKTLIIVLAQQIGKYYLVSELIDQAFAEEEERPWEPKNGQNYWFWTDAGFSMELNYRENSDVDQYRRSVGNMFQTKQEADQHGEDFKTFLKDRSNKR